MRKTAFGLAALIILSVCIPSAFAQAPQISTGLTWLYSAQTTTGNWPEVTTTDYYSTAAAMDAVSSFDPSNPSYGAAFQWLSTQIVSPTDYLSRQIIALKRAGQDTSGYLASLLLYCNSDGGFGGADGYPNSYILDTALALQALKAANYSDATVLYQAVNFLTTNQNSDGGWGFSKDNPSNVYMTAIVSATLQQFPQTTALATAINKATSYLLAHQNTDGGFGSSPSQVYETALAYKALANVITDATVLGNAVNYLTATQAAVGSWNEDPYSTALALQALHLAETRPSTPPPTSTTGTVNGIVVDGSTSQPLSGVSAILASNPAIAALTDSTGSFSLANIPQGPQQITFTLTGYATSTAAMTVTAGSIMHIGNIPLTAAPNTGIIQGTVTDSSNGASLSGVTIMVTGASTWTAITAANGSYKITGIAPGSVALSASKSGYTTVIGQTIVTAGETLVFSPSLAATPPVPATGGLQGTVVDSATGLSLPGAAISAAGAKSHAATTDASGSFLFSSLDVGSYVVTVSASGYGTQTYTVTIIAGTTMNLGSIVLILNPTTGTVQGTVTDASAGTPISGVAVTVTGSAAGTAVTSSDGSYQLTGLAPGTVTLSASKTGYNTAAGTGTVVAGGILVHDFSLTSAPTATTGEVKGAFIDTSTRQPVAGVVVTLTSSGTGALATAASDTSGAFFVHSVAPGNNAISVSAQGYLGQTSTLTVVSGSTTDLGTISLQPASTTTTITGLVTDAATGAALPEVDVSIVGTTLTAKTDSAGAYTIAGITSLTFTLKTSLAGYDSFTADVSTTGYNLYTMNLSLSPSKVSTLRILTVQTDQASYSAYADVTVTATVENFGNAPVDAVISAEISDGLNIIAIATPINPNLNLASHTTATVSLTWNTGQAAPSNYVVHLKATEPQTDYYSTQSPFLLSELSTELTITASPAISGALSLSPPVTQENMQTPITVTAAIRNTGNIPLTSIMRVEAALEGSAVYAQDVTISDLPVNNLLQLDLGSFTPGSGGNYTVTFTPADPSIVSNITTTLYVGPYATGVFTATPAKVPPGSAAVSGKIALTGVGAMSGSVQDPLVPIIKDALQKGVNWGQTNAVSWQNKNPCNGCHVQAQTLIGLGLSRDKVIVDDSKSQLLLDFMKSCQAPDGSETRYPGATRDDLPVESTVLYAWSLSYFHDAVQIQDSLTRAVDYLITRQYPSGYWMSDYCYGLNDWWNDLDCNISYKPSTPFTAYNIISLAKAYQLTGTQKYKDALLKAAGYLQNLDHTSSTITAAHIAIGLHSALPYIDNPMTQTSINTKMANVLAYVKSMQNADGGWGRYSGNASDPMPTSHVLYALSFITDMQNDAATIRSAATYLLNKQNADGSWTTKFVRNSTIIPDQHFGVTTWAIISLPATLNSIAGVAAELTVVFPSNVSPAYFSFMPTSTTTSGESTTYTWDFGGLLESGMDIKMDMILTGLLSGERRNIAQDARLSFMDSYTGNTIVLPIGIPAVNVLDPASISVTTDKGQYSANENIQIATAIMNNGSMARSATVRLAIEDQAGTLVSELTSAATQLDPNYFPGWNYRIPAPVTAVRNMINTVAGVSVDFAHELQSLGLSNMTVEKNSIRVLERDAAGSVIGEKQAQAAFTSDTNALVTWVLDGTTAQGTTRHFLLYFDITDNGFKPVSPNTQFPPTGKLIAFSDEAGNVSIIESNGDGAFGAARLVEDVTSATDYTRGVAVDDFNNDGFADIVTGSGANGEIYYYQNKADGVNTFNAKVKIGSISSSDYTMSIAAGDFNHDGNKDFVVSGNNMILYLFLGKGDGSFKQSTLASPSGEFSLRAKFAVDVDRDGKIDLLVSVYGSGGLYFCKGNGDGTFQAPVLLSKLGRDSYGLAVGDFNEDGMLDVLRSSDYAGATYLYKGNGNGTFGAGTLIPSLNTGTISVYAAGDFNNDGHVDVIAANGTGTIEFYPGNGDGTFGQKTTIATASGASLGVSASPALSDVRAALGSPEAVPAQYFSFIWNTGSTPPDNYRVHAVLSEAQETISENYASFAILPDVRANAQVVTDKSSYNPNETATLTSTITSQSANYIMENLSARIAVSREAAGGSGDIFTETKTIATLMPGSSFTFKSYWNTGTHAPGTYPVTLEVKDASGAVIATGAQNLVIANVVKPSTALKGSISVDKQSLMSGEPVAVSYSVTNKGNIDLADVALSVQTVHVVNQTVYDNLSSQATITMGGTYTGSGTFNTTTYSAKDYLVVLRANIAGVEETLAGTYFRVEGAPTAPALIAPAMGSDMDTFTPSLIVSNASDPNDDKLTYEFELYADSGLSQLLASSGLLSEGTGTTGWTAPFNLTENATCYWRSRAYDGRLYGSWMDTASFRVNTVNDPPTAPAPLSPADTTSVSVLMPILTVTNAADPDSTGLTYNFDIAVDPDFISKVTSTTGVFAGSGTTSWQVPVSLQENATYYWRAQADDWQIEGPWSATARFFVNTANDAPTAPTVTAPANGGSITALATDIVLANSTDPDSSVLAYSFELDTVNTFDSPNLVRSNAVPEGQIGTTLWSVTNLTDNTLYFVRAKASDGQAESPWSAGSSFFVNTTNDPPTTPVLANPSNGAGVTVSTPTLSVYNSTDLDKDVLTYEFEVYSDAALTSLVTSTMAVAETSQTTAWTVSVALTENQTYYWRCRAFDGKAASAWSAPASFFVNTANDAPGAPVLNSPAEASTVTTLLPTLSITNAIDPDSDTLTYDFELYSGGVLIQTITNAPPDSSGITSLALTTPLVDNTVYQWSARANDGDRYGPWMTTASFTVHLPQTGIKVEVEFEPETLNKKSEGKWVMVEIELPHGYRAPDVDISSIRLEGAVPAEPWPHELKKRHHEHGCDQDHAEHDHGELKVKFKRSDVIAVLPAGSHVPVHVTGKVGATTFEGVDVIRVMQ